MVTRQRRDGRRARNWYDEEKRGATEHTQTPGTGGGRVDSNSGGKEPRDASLDERITVVTRMRACGPFALLLTQATARIW